MDPMDKERAAEQWLDNALNDFSKAEPRAGLEKRVLATLNAQRGQLATRRHWWWIAGVAAAAAVVLVVFWMGRAGSPDKSANTTTASHQFDNLVQKQLNEPHRAPTRPIARPASVPKRRAVVAALDAPKLAQFPAPRKLSQQELLLLRYAQNNPGASVAAESFAQGEAADLHVNSMDVQPLAIQDLAETQNENN